MSATRPALRSESLHHAAREAGIAPEMSRLQLAEKHRIIFAMTIHLSKDLERFVHNAVRAGHYASEDDVVNDALARLREAMPRDVGTADRRTKRAKPAKQKQPRTKEEFHRHLVEIGLMSQLPDTDADYDDPNDQLINIKGEPLSETVIRERR
jgi:Arc/MetJ-type ribon-helix-helix transcriptional regulator